MSEQQPEGFGLQLGEPREKTSVIFKNSYTEHNSLWLLRRVGKIYTIFSDIEEEMSWFSLDRFHHAAGISFLFSLIQNHEYCQM